jgi:hypothetical protein
MTVFNQPTFNFGLVKLTVSGLIIEHLKVKLHPRPLITVGKYKKNTNYYSYLFCNKSVCEKKNIEEK